VRPRYAWHANEEHEFDSQQRQIHCQRKSYMGAFRGVGLGTAAGALMLLAFTWRRAVPTFQTRAMVLAMTATGGLWVGMERTYVACAMRMTREMAVERGVGQVGAGDDILVDA